MKPGVSLATARAAKPKALRVLNELIGDVAVGIVPLGDRRYGLKVNLVSTPRVLIPEEIDDVPLVVEVVGRIQKH